MNITTKITTVTPELAAKWLTQNTHNRKISQRTIDSYARDMKAGLWELTDQGIGFNGNNTLLNGQHRLMACIKAKTPFPCIIVTGLTKESQFGMDGGKKRSVGDQLHLRYDTDNATVKVAVVNCIAGSLKGVGRISLSPNIAYKFIDLYDDEIEFVLSDRGSNAQLSFTPALASLVLAAKVDMDKTIEFKEKYFHGNDLSSGQPALTLRNFMLSRGQWATSGTGYRMTIMNYAATALMHHFNFRLLHKLVASSKGYEYFINKQKSCVTMMTEWLSV